MNVKLELIFKELIEIKNKFGPNKKFISLDINNRLNHPSDPTGNLLVANLKIYDVIENRFNQIDLFIKVEPKVLKQCYEDDDDEIIRYNFKFHNENVAYERILPILNEAYCECIGEINSSTAEELLSYSELNATRNGGKNDTRYFEQAFLGQNAWLKTTGQNYYAKNSDIDVNDAILRLFPKFYYGEIYEDNREDGVIVIENMLAAGFTSSKETICLDLSHVLLTLETLGKFHASSYIAKHSQPTNFAGAVEGLKATGWMLPAYWDIYPNFINQHLLRGINFLKNDPAYRKHIHKFDAMLKNTKDYFFNLIKTEEDIAVVCHGDFCRNNILFKYYRSWRDIEDTWQNNDNTRQNIQKMYNTHNATRDHVFEEPTRDTHEQSRDSNEQMRNYVEEEMKYKDIVTLEQSKYEDRAILHHQTKMMEAEVLEEKLLGKSMEMNKTDFKNEFVNSSDINDRRKEFLRNILEPTTSDSSKRRYMRKLQQLTSQIQKERNEFKSHRLNDHFKLDKIEYQGYTSVYPSSRATNTTLKSNLTDLHEKFNTQDDRNTVEIDTKSAQKINLPIVEETFVKKENTNINGLNCTLKSNLTDANIENYSFHLHEKVNTQADRNTVEIDTKSADLPIVEETFVKKENTNVNGLNCCEENHAYHAHESSANKSKHSTKYVYENNLIQSNRKQFLSRILSSDEELEPRIDEGQKKTEDFGKSGSQIFGPKSFVEEDNSIQSKSQHFNTKITDRLEFLEDRYKQLERVYNTNKRVLEERKLNSKIIEKLNERKQILEDICKKIENISKSHRMENQFHTCINKLYHNLDEIEIKQSVQRNEQESNRIDKEINRLSESLNSEGISKTKNINEIQKYVGETDVVPNSNREEKDRPRHNGSNVNVTQELKNIEQEFSSIYDETFAEENVTNYEELFTELSHSRDSSSPDIDSVVSYPDDEYVSLLSVRRLEHAEHSSRRKEENTFVKQSKIGESENNSIHKFCEVETTENISTQIFSTQSEIPVKKSTRTADNQSPPNVTIICAKDQQKIDNITSSVKERVYHFERSVSVSNELNSVEKKLRRSSSDINQLMLNRTLVSERNINLCNNKFDSDKEIVKKELMKALQEKTRYSKDDNASIDETEEVIYDEVFYDIDTYEADSNAKYEPKERPMIRTHSLADVIQDKRPVPMKRTISLIQETVPKPQNITSNLRRHDNVLLNVIESTDVANNSQNRTEKVFYVSDEDDDLETNKPYLNRNYSTNNLNTSVSPYYEELTKTLQFLSHERTSNEIERKIGTLILFKDNSKTKRNESVDAIRSEQQDVDVPEREQRLHKSDTKAMPRKEQLISEKESSLTETRTVQRTNESLHLGESVLRGGGSDDCPSPSGMPNMPVDILFFDLARMIYTSPVIDLSFFLLLNTSHELRSKHWDDFISTYYNSVKRNVPPNVPIPSVDQLLVEIKNKCVYGYFLCCFFLPWMMEESPHQDVDQWIHHGGQPGTEAIADILRFLIDRDYI